MPKNTPASQANGLAQQLVPPSKLRRHAQAELLPPLPSDEQRSLLADIAASGIRLPLAVTGDGTVLDGHLRLQLAIELGIAEVPVVIVEPADQVEFLVRSNILRRHLTAGQRAALVLELETILQAQEMARNRSRANLKGQPSLDEADLPPRGRTRDQAAELGGVSARTVQNVAAVKEAAPDLYCQVRLGATSADKAYRLVKQRERDAGLGDPPPMPTDPAAVILADPPWRVPGDPGSTRSIERHYPTMSAAEIKGLRIPAADDAILFLWSVPGMLHEALDVMAAWGFVYVDQIVWDKEIAGLGSWTRHRHELLLIGVRGNFRPPATSRRIPSVIRSRRGRHSEKPVAVHEAIERMYPNLPRLELFARQQRVGWSSWGNQADPSQT